MLTKSESMRDVLLTETAKQMRIFNKVQYIIDYHQPKNDVFFDEYEFRVSLAESMAITKSRYELIEYGSMITADMLKNTFYTNNSINTITLIIFKVYGESIIV